jgi:predicted nicotinamide N-methyase
MEDDLGSFFTDTEYVLQEFTVGQHSQQVYILKAASTDFDLTGQVLWPAATYLAQYLSDHSALLESTEVLEVGAGAGLTGLLCAQMGARVVLSDYHPTVLSLLRKNAPLAKGSVSVVALDWSSADCLADLEGQEASTAYSLIIGSDVVFWPAMIPFLFKTVRLLLRPDGRFVLGYTQRSELASRLMFEAAALEGFHSQLLAENGAQFIYEFIGSHS